MRYIATGRVQPERADIRFTPIEWRIPEHGNVVAYCHGSQLTLVLDIASIDGWATAYQQAKHFALMTVGTLGFALGAAFRIELIQVIAENGLPHVFGAEAIGRLPDQSLRIDQPDSGFNRAIQLANKDVWFRLAMRDYLNAIDDAVDCAMYCDRAIETLRTALRARPGADAAAVDAALGLAAGALDTIVKPHATPLMDHGPSANAPATDNDSRWAMMTLTRDVLLRYLDQPSSA